MADLVLDGWPVGELATERLVLRESRESDRDGLIALVSNAEAYRYLGGAMSREQAEEVVRPPYGNRHGSFVILEEASGESAGCRASYRTRRLLP
jgi:hypothetical protein